MSNYDSLKQRYIEDSKSLKLPTAYYGGKTVEVDQGILYLKGAACHLIDSIQKGECDRYTKKPDDDLRTFRSGKDFGFTESYVNYLMLIARNDGYAKGYAQGMQNGRELGAEDEKQRMRGVLGLGEG